MLAICAIIVQCKTCASFLLIAKQHFKCPICEVFKGLRSTHATSIHVKSVVPDADQTYDSRGNIHNPPPDFYDAVTDIDEEVHYCQRSRSLLPDYASSFNDRRSKINYIRIQRQLFITFHQLKIFSFME